MTFLKIPKTTSTVEKCFSNSDRIRNGNLLTHLFPMHSFSTPWKHQKIVRFCEDSLTLLYWRSLSYKNQSIDLESRFLHDTDIRHEGVVSVRFCKDYLPEVYMKFAGYSAWMSITSLMLTFRVNTKTLI